MLIKINIMKNWKTTVIGILGGAAQILALPINSWKDLVVPLVTVLIGVFAKDAGTSGKGI